MAKPSAATTGRVPVGGVQAVNHPGREVCEARVVGGVTARSVERPGEGILHRLSKKTSGEVAMESLARREGCRGPIGQLGRRAPWINTPADTWQDRAGGVHRH